jgi:hypothetical protein
MISLRTEMKNLRIILALACSFTTSTHAVAQSKAAPRAAGTVFRDCQECPEMVVVPAGSFTMGSSPQEKSWRQAMAVVWDRLLMKLRNIRSHCRHSPWASMTSLVASTRLSYKPGPRLALDMQFGSAIV